jgi:hypothetical protein
MNALLFVIYVLICTLQIGLDLYKGRYYNALVWGCVTAGIMVAASFLLKW